MRVGKRLEHSWGLVIHSTILQEQFERDWVVCHPYGTLNVRRQICFSASPHPPRCTRDQHPQCRRCGGLSCPITECSAFRYQPLPAWGDRLACTHSISGFYNYQGFVSNTKVVGVFQAGEGHHRSHCLPSGGVAIQYAAKQKLTCLCRNASSTRKLFGARFHVYFKAIIFHTCTYPLLLGSACVM